LLETSKNNNRAEILPGYLPKLKSNFLKIFTYFFPAYPIITFLPNFIGTNLNLLFPKTTTPGKLSSIWLMIVVD
jgi:hypothetical protein